MLPKSVCWLNKCILVFPLFLLFLFINDISSQPRPDKVIYKRFPTKFHVKLTVKLQNNTLQLNNDSGFEVRIACPIPTTNMYHDVGPISVNQGKIIKFENADDRMVMVVGKNKLPDNVIIEYDLTTYRIHIDFSKINVIYPYDKSKEEYIKYASAGSIEINHPQIKQIVDEIWNDSTNVLDYARKAYIALQKRLKWKTTGQYETLTQIFNNGGGDCGALSHVYMALLRNKGIPARGIIGGMISDAVQFDGHMWTEFYLEKYGWIPADVSIRSEIPYFGVFNGWALGYHRGSDFIYKLNGKEYKTGSIQHPYASHWYSVAPAGNFSYTNKVHITLVKNSNIDEVYNSNKNNTKKVNALLKYVNDLRKQKGISVFEHSADLSKVLRNHLKRKLVNNRELDLFWEMVNIGYITNGFYVTRSILLDFDFDIIKWQINKLKDFEKYLINPHFTQIAIGYYYKNGHNFFVAVAKRKNICDVNAKDISSTVGKTFYMNCPANCVSGRLWGTDIYTGDSSIAAAARHSGAINENGGRVKVTIKPGRNRYTGSVRNGVTSKDWGAYEVSFTVSRD